VFHRGNFFEMALEKSEESALTIGSIPAHFFLSKSIASPAN
jgi:hypothetical protein